MLTRLVDSYLELRRSTGFRMKVKQYLLHNFASFAAERGETYIRTLTAVEWAAQAPSEGQRANRLGMLRVFARFARAEDAGHEVPADRVFSARRVRYRPFILFARSITRTADMCIETSSCWIDPAMDLYDALLVAGRHRLAHFRGAEPPPPRHN